MNGDDMERIENDDPRISIMHEEDTYLAWRTADSGELARILFQVGPIPRAGVNGVQVEDLIHVCVHRLQEFQNSPGSCRENALAITKLEEAIHWLQARTRDRVRRKVEGTLKA